MLSGLRSSPQHPPNRYSDECFSRLAQRLGRQSVQSRLYPRLVLDVRSTHEFQGMSNKFPDDELHQLADTLLHQFSTENREEALRYRCAAHYGPVR